MVKLEEISFKNSKGQKLLGTLWTPTKYKHTIIIVNGIGNTREEWIPWPNKIVKLGYRVLTFDFRGRDGSEGKFIETTLTTGIDDLKSAVDFLDSDVALVGGSFGGTASICLAAVDKRIRCLITMASAHNFDDWYNGKRLAEAKKKGYTIISSEPGKKYTLELFEDTRRHKVLDKAKKIKVPWLIIHGDKDIGVLVHHAKDLYAAAKCIKRLAIIKGADHDFSSNNANAQLFSLLINWLKRYLK